MKVTDVTQTFNKSVYRMDVEIDEIGNEVTYYVTYESGNVEETPDITVTKDREDGMYSEVIEDEAEINQVLKAMEDFGSPR